MDAALVIAGCITIVFAGAAVLLGSNLTRSVMIGYAFVGALCLALLVAGAGYLAIVVSIVCAIALASIQVFGWMLVDVDRDHLAPTDGPTWVARGLAFVLLGGGLSILVMALAPELAAEASRGPLDVGALGELFFGRLGGAALLLGIAVAAALLATMLLLRTDEGGK